MSENQVTAVAVRKPEEMGLASLGGVLAGSGFFKDVRSAGQAMVKVLAGRELGLGPIQSMTGIHVIEGKIAVGAGLLGALVKRSGRYNYVVAAHTDTECVIDFFEGGKKIGTSKFDMADAVKAGVSKNPVWAKYPRNMLFARAMSNGVRWYTADVTAGPVYVPEELGAEVNSEGDAINVEVVAPVSPPPSIAPEKPVVATTAPRPSVPPAGTEGNQETGTLAKVFVDPGETNGKPWTKYQAIIDGQKYTTFDLHVGEDARDAEGTVVSFAWKPARNPKYRDLLWVRRTDGDSQEVEGEPLNDVPASETPALPF